MKKNALFSLCALRFCVKQNTSKIFLFFSLLLCTLCVKPQPPATEIYLLDIDNHPSHIHVGKLRNISNSKGYDSQPCFSAEGGSIIYSSIRNGEKQADVYEYQIKTNQTLRLTNTPESEYSPTFVGDRVHFSSVRVEIDSSQRLWQFKYQSSEKPKRILDKAIDSVGYHCWFTQGKLALFILTEPVSLHLAEVGNWETKKIAENPGRCMAKVPFEEAFYFVDKSDSAEFFISKYTNNLHERTEGKIEKLFPVLKGSEDFCLTPDGDFIMAFESKLYILKPAEKKWTQFAELKNEGINGITRLAMSADGKRLAIVAKE